MNILVTTGTTEFDELLLQLVRNVNDFSYTLVIQSPSVDKFNEELKSTGAEYFAFCDDILEYYNWADIVVTHAGAGSVYRLLELEKRVVVVPNTYRKDIHQIQLANYINDNNYGATCFNVSNLFDTIQKCLDIDFSPYRKDVFDGEELILDFLDDN